jgi:GDP-L-fucose synthase
MPKNVAVAGGTGFLGRHVVRLARQAGHQVTSLSRREGCDITDLNSFEARLHDLKPESLINCAAHVGGIHYFSRRAADVVHDNMQMLLNIYRGVQRASPGASVINPISNCSYPADAKVLEETGWLEGRMHQSVLPFGGPRRMIYALAECYRAQGNLRSINWLVPNAYGPGDHNDPQKVHALNGIILRLIAAQRAGAQTFEIWGTGKPVREWCYVEDAARVLVDSIGADEQVYPINIAQNKGHSIAEIARTAAEALGFDVELVFNPKYPDGVSIKVMDDKQFRARFPSFEFTPLDVGIRRTIDYYRSILTAA